MVQALCKLLPGSKALHAYSWCSSAKASPAAEKSADGDVHDWVLAASEAVLILHASNLALCRNGCWVPSVSSHTPEFSLTAVE